MNQPIRVYCQPTWAAVALLVLSLLPGMAQPTNCTTPPNGLVGWWRAEGNANDAAGVNHGQLLNNAGYATGLVGQAFNLNSVSASYIQVPDSDLWAFGTNDFSVELWVNFRTWNPSGNYYFPEAIFAANDEGAGPQNKWIFCLDNGKLTLIVCSPTLGALYLIQAPFAPTVGQWYHLALVRSGNVFTTYVNGVAVGSQTLSLDIPNANAPLNIGQAEGLGYVNGLIDELSIYQHALSQTEVQAIYNAGSQGKCPPTTAPVITSEPADQVVPVGSSASFTVTATGSSPLTCQWYYFQTNLLAGATNISLTLTNVQPGQAGYYSVVITNAYGIATSSNALLTVITNCLPLPSGLVGWWRGEGNVSDSFGLNDGTLVNGAGFGNGLVGRAFNLSPGNSGYIQVPDSDLWAFGTNDFSIELWVDFRSWSPSGVYYSPEAVFAANDEGPGTLNKWMFCLVSGNLELIVCSPTLGALYLIQAPFSPNLNQWYHLALVRNGNNFTAFTNGVAAGSQNLPLNIPNPSAPLTLGQAEGIGFLDGLLDEVSIYRRALTGAEVASIYSNGGGGKCASSIQPAFISQPMNQTVTVGTNATFTALVAGTPPLTYQWYFNATNLVTGATNSTLTLTNVQPEFAGAYSLMASNLLGAATSSNALLTVTTNSPIITSHPTNRSVLVGASASFTVAAAGSFPLSYQWYRGGGILVTNATNSTLVLTNILTGQAGTYFAVASNAFGTAASSNATLTVAYPPIGFQIRNTNSLTSSFLSTPVIWSPNGNENALSFSLSFDTTKLTYNGIALGSGSTGAELILNTAQIASGKLGVSVQMPPGSTFTAGIQQLVLINWWVPSLAGSTTTPILFADTPLARQCWDNQLNSLPAGYTNGTLTITIAPGYEGDAYPRPSGDKSLALIDWLQIGRYAARLDYPTNATEFQRADCAPRSSLGNGSITVADWVQSGRYVFGWDLPTAVGGPQSAQTFTGPGTSPSRLLSLPGAALLPGHSTNLSILLAAQGNENAVGFSLRFEPSLTRFVSAGLGLGAAGASLYVNTNLLTSGLLGFALVLPPGNAFPAATKELVQVVFEASTLASGSFLPTFTDQLVIREVASPTADSLPVGFQTSPIVVYPSPTLTVGVSEENVVLTWPAWAADFSLQMAPTNLPPDSTWMTLPATPQVSNDLSIVVLPLSAGPNYYRLYHP